MMRRPPRSTLSSSSAASDVYKRQAARLRARCPRWGRRARALAPASRRSATVGATREALEDFRIDAFRSHRGPARPPQRRRATERRSCGSAAGPARRHGGGRRRDHGREPRHRRHRPGGTRGHVGRHGAVSALGVVVAVVSVAAAAAFGAYIAAWVDIVLARAVAGVPVRPLDALIAPVSWGAAVALKARTTTERPDGETWALAPALLAALAAVGLAAAPLAPLS